MSRSVVHASCFILALVFLAADGFVCVSAAAPVSPWHYRPYQTEDGLPDNSITGVNQTTDGFLWIATRGGLVCFNGEEFTPLPQANLPALPSRTVRAMFCDRRDRLWVAMERGPVFCFKSDGLERFTAAKGLPGQRVRVLAMMEDAAGAVWIVYPNQLRRILNGQVQSIALPSDWLTPVDLVAAADRQGNIWCAQGANLGMWRDGEWRSSTSLNGPVTAISAGSKSNLWISAGGRLLQYQEGQPPVELVSLPSNTVPRVLIEDQSGALWIGAAPGGLLRWDGNHLTSVPTSERTITCLYEDREGNIWAGTGAGGLNLIRPRTVSFMGGSAELPFEAVLSVTEDQEGSLWAVAQDGQLFRAKNGRWEGLSDWPGGSATCVAADPSGGVWVGTLDRGLKSFRDGKWRGWLQRNERPSDTVRSILVASNGDVWAASATPNRLHRLRDGNVLAITNSTPLGPIRAMAEGVDGTIWIGTSDGEIQRVRDLSLVAESGIAEPTPLSVRSLLATADGSLWIGYAGDGLGRLKAGQYHRLTTAAGLADDFISQLLADDRGILWLAGNRGLSCVSLSQLNAVMEGRGKRVSARVYGRADGLPGVQPSRDYFPSAWHARDGRLWFSMRSGLLAVEPDQIGDNPLPPPVQLEQVNVDDEPVAIYNAGSPLQTHSGSNLLNLRGRVAPLPIGPGHRKVEINFAALSFSSPENVQFRYRLDGFDKNWVEVGPQHGAIYPHLPAGDYEFRVLACNSAGVWNQDGAWLSLRVLQFYWETWWFKIGGGLVMVLLAGGTVFVVVRQRYRRKILRSEARRALEHERARIAKDIHDDLGSSLTRISLLSQPIRSGGEDAESATNALAQIHRTARDLTHAMGEVVWAVNPEHDTFDSLANYLSQYSQSFLKLAGIRCRLELPLQLPQRPVSAEVRHNLFLAFKEALNNVVRHAAASEVQIALIPDSAGFELIVTDNGKGLSAGKNVIQPPGHPVSRAASGNGLANMRSRLHEIGGDCELRSEPGSGTKIIFRVRLKSYHEHS